MAEQLDSMSYQQVLGSLQAQPKRVFLWTLAIDGIDAVLMRKRARPKLKFSERKIDYLNAYRKYAGKAEWDPMEIESNDPIVPSAAQKYMQWVRLQYEFATGRGGYAAVYKKDVTLKMLGPAGTTVQQWDVKGAWLSNIDFKDLDYSNQADVAIVSATVTFDGAILRF